jgi:hypothetical protein
MKTYVLTVSRTFPATHNQKGQPTFFVEKIYNKIAPMWKEGSQELIKERKLYSEVTIEKIHTIRGNYELWKKRIDEVIAGNAYLSLRYWSGSPYNYKKDGSKQVEFARLDNESGVGIQKLEDPTNFVFAPINGKMINWEEIAKNDGLSFDDFCDWFKVRQNKPMAIIHFTNFRY